MKRLLLHNFCGLTGRGYDMGRAAMQAAALAFPEGFRMEKAFELHNFQSLTDTNIRRCPEFYLWHFPSGGGRCHPFFGRFIRER